MVFGLLAALTACSLAAQFPAVERSTAPIIVVYPPERMALPLAQNQIVLGSISDPKALFLINGQTVTAHANGGFLAWLPVQPGAFTFNCELRGASSATYQRSVLFGLPPVALPEGQPAIDEDFLSPKTDLDLRPGDWLTVQMKATPRAQAQFRLAKSGWMPLREANPSLGIYEGVYAAQAGDEWGPAPVEFKIGSGWSSKTAKSKGWVALSSRPGPIAAVKSGPPVPVRTGPGEGELFYALGGTRFVTAGKAGPETRVSFSSTLNGWIETKNLDFLPVGTRPPRAATDAITMKTSTTDTTVRIGLTDRVPFIIEESEDFSSLVVRLYTASTRTNWIVYKSSDDFVDEVRLKQESSDVVAATIRLFQGRRIWGYHASFDGNSLKLELRHPPALAAAPASPLSGRVIFLDPGHMPSQPGTAIGPLGTREMDVNFAIAKAVEALLLKEKATPILSRIANEDDVGLIDRPRLAWEKKADVFISIHNNSLTDSGNPFSSPHGYSIFYYHSRGLPLARALYRSYQKLVPIPGEELRFGNLLVLRMTEMPAVLTESAYMSFPNQEEMLLDPKFRGKIAEAIVDGLRSFLDKERTRQLAARPQKSK